MLMKKTTQTLAAIALSALLLAGCETATAPNTANTSTSVITPLTNEMTPKTATAETQATQATPAAESQSDAPKTGDTIATIETDMGTIKVRLFPNGVPTLTKNFVELAKSGKYTNTPFHRVVKNFMIQGGDFTKKNGMGGYSFNGPDTYLANEINPSYSHLYGTISMAKSGAPVSIGSQFFIVTNKNGAGFLDGNYSPFGQVYEGMDIAEKIQNLQKPGTEQPSKIVNVKKITIGAFAAAAAK